MSRPNHIIRIACQGMGHELAVFLKWVASQHTDLKIVDEGDIFDVYPPDAAVTEDGGFFWCVHNTKILDHMGINAVKAPPMPERCAHCGEPPNTECLVCEEYRVTPRMP